MKKPDVEKLLGQEKLSPYQRAKLAIYDVLEKERNGKSVLTSEEIETIFFPYYATDKEQKEFTGRIKLFEKFNLFLSECERCVYNTLLRLTRLKNHARNNMADNMLDRLKSRISLLPGQVTEKEKKQMIELVENLSLLNLQQKEVIPHRFQVKWGKDMVRQFFMWEIEEIEKNISKIKALIDTGEELSSKLGIDITQTPTMWLEDIEMEITAFNSLLQMAQRSMAGAKYADDDIPSFDYWILKDSPLIELEDIDIDMNFKAGMEEKIESMEKQKTP